MKRECLLFDYEDADGCHADKGHKIPADWGVFVALHETAVDVFAAEEVVYVGL